MTLHPITEGEVAYDVPHAGKPVKTYYKIIGDLSSGVSPLIGLHGGPGSGHNYLVVLADILQKHGIPIVIYDQIGCGRSTHFKERMGDGAFWSFDLFVGELDNLIDHLNLRDRGFYILGQSWGGVLGANYAARQPRGLKKLVISSGPASISKFEEGLKRLVSELPADIRAILEECERKGDTESAEYQKVVSAFTKAHVCRLDPYPDEIKESQQNLRDDPTPYMTIQGPSEFTVVGSIKGYEGWETGHKIQVETLLLNGRYDEVTDESVEPWFRTIPKVKWVTLENSSHTGMFEDRERYMYLVGAFLSSPST